uniref:Leucine rich repeat containing 43 n=1 Tax=Buteo japonicus TaxID=224669 RepID=A0A8B9YY11_9AVES
NTYPTGTRAAKPGTSVVSAAFWEHLRHLGLQDFPCGIGSWNKSRFNACTNPCGGQLGPGTAAARQEEAVPLGEESPDVLMELLSDRHSPWALLPDCSPQDQRLREMAVLAPELVHGSNVFQVLRSLRIVGKGVSAVDEGLLQLQQLEELILSTNQISRITSANLPRTLKVLELCCNVVADLQDLCARPPPELQHLGLGYNRLCGPSEHKYLTAAFWPNLVSLDLSFNNFTDLLGLVSQLSSLQKLRILLLQGNPLALIPTYRGFLVDSLPRLSILDDIHIGPEERHQFQGLARQPDFSQSEAQVVVSIGEIKGVPDPSTRQQLEVGSEAPVITYSYCVTYKFVEGEEIEGGSSTEAALPLGPDVNTTRHALPKDPSLFQVTKIHQRPVVATLDVDSSAQDTRETKGQQEPAAMEESLLRAFLCPCTVKVFVTPGKPWADTIDCSYRKEHTAKDLVGLKSYLACGTIVSVVEEKVSVSSPRAGKYSHEGEGKTGSAKGQCQGRMLGENDVPVPGDKQKKKEKPCELRSNPPIRRTLGTQRVTLETLLATEDLVATVCDFGILITEQPLQRGKKAKARAKNQKQRVSPAGKPQHLPKVTETRAGWAEGGVCKSKQQRCPARRQPQVPVTLPALLSRVLTHILSFRL